MTHDEMIKAIKAHKEGKQLQIRPKCSGKMDCTWRDLMKDEEPVWNFQHVEYRAKPEPLTFYARISDNNQVASINKDRKPIEINYSHLGGRIVKLQEVEE